MPVVYVLEYVFYTEGGRAKTASGESGRERAVASMVWRTRNVVMATGVAVVMGVNLRWRTGISVPPFPPQTFCVVRRVAWTCSSEACSMAWPTG